MSIDGRQIPHSAITELLLHTLRKKNAEAEAPAGRFKFEKFLINIETPVNLIENPNVLKIGKILTAPTNTAERRLPQRGAILASSVEGENIVPGDAPTPMLKRSKKQAKNSGCTLTCNRARAHCFTESSTTILNMKRVTRAHETSGV